VMTWNFKVQLELPCLLGALHGGAACCHAYLWLLPSNSLAGGM
jgi:hypothetical protein